MNDQDHYFSTDPSSPSEPSQIEVSVRGRRLTLHTDRGVFSRRQADKGTLLLLQYAELPDSGAILDLGCGYGLVGLVAALDRPDAGVTLVDVNSRATDLARQNCDEAGVSNVEVLTGDAPEALATRTFDSILCNPPYAAGKRVFMALLEDAAKRLNPDGSLWIVGRTKQGIKTVVRDLSPLFASAETVKIRGGYRVMRLQASGGDDEQRIPPE